MKTILSFAIATLIAAPAFAAPVAFKIDPSHAQVGFSYNHFGFSTTSGLFGGVEGTINFDAEAPANSSVEASFPVSAMLTGWKDRDGHFQSKDFFNPENGTEVTFKSTKVEVTGDKTGLITGDLTMNGVTKEVVLDAVLNNAAVHPMENKDWLGFSATATVLRSDFGLGMFVPAVSDEVAITISLEAGKAE